MMQEMNPIDHDSDEKVPLRTKIRLYQAWPGNNAFLCKGRLFVGSDWRSTLATLFGFTLGGVFFGLIPISGANNVTTTLSFWAVYFLDLAAYILSLAFLYLCCFRDPGVIPRHTARLEALDITAPLPPEMQGMKYCETCCSFRPQRASHCSECNNCVLRVGNCIGERNYRFFIGFLLSTSALCLTLMGLCIAHLLGSIALTESVGGGLIRSWPACAAFFVALFGTLFTVPLAIQHMRLVFINQTTRENVKGFYNMQPNPFNLGWLANLYSLLFGTMKRGMDFREILPHGHPLLTIEPRGRRLLAALGLPVPPMPPTPRELELMALSSAATPQDGPTYMPSSSSPQKPQTDSSPQPPAEPVATTPPQAPSATDPGGEKGLFKTVSGAQIEVLPAAEWGRPVTSTCECLSFPGARHLVCGNLFFSSPPNHPSNMSNNVYLPPHKMAQLAAKITDKSSIEFQQLAWTALRKSVNGLINKANVSNLRNIIPEIFSENIIRGRGLFARSIIKAQIASPSFTNVYAAVVAVINPHFPALGELVLTRLILTFRKSYRRNDKPICLATVRFLAHLINQQVAHETLALEICALLLEHPTEDSVEIAAVFLRECGQLLLEVAASGLQAIFEQLRTILSEGTLDPRVQYVIESLMEIRKKKFEEFPSIVPELDIVESDTQITHELSLSDDNLDPQTTLDLFHFEPEFEKNNQSYARIKEGILGDQAALASRPLGLR
ncbi:putative Pre-mRNA-splicing factor cwf22 [Paratrimastix pyriformis]|uniref:Palmitoyltransferase n=1 Tax=Paratrimastix pyriformis TaxID=342808 RepID=A0ABQ8UQ12_9EUKA|nr:putative Pre-mRNA-splicing factor cwf22 [Paratrimastix pyriformis]